MGELKVRPPLADLERVKGGRVPSSVEIQRRLNDDSAVFFAGIELDSSTQSKTGILDALAEDQRYY